MAEEKKFAQFNAQSDQELSEVRNSNAKLNG